MRLVVVIDSLGLGGAERLLVTLGRHGPAAGLDLSVVSLREVGSTVVADELAAQGVPVTYVPSRSRHHLADPRRLLRLANELRRSAPDVVQTHLGTANILGGAAARLTSTPVVGTLHHLRGECGGIRTRAEDTALQRASAVVAVGHEVARTYAEALAPQSITVVPNPVDLARFETSVDQVLPVRHCLLGERQAVLLVAVGRLVWEKGYEVLLDAVRLLVDRRVPVVLAIAGEGPLAAPLGQQIVNLGLEQHVQLLGVRRDIPRLLGAADVFVSSSHAEGLPLAVLEAMAAGAPVVATDVGDVGRALGGAGVVVPPGDPAALASAVAALVEDPGRRWHLAARGRDVVRKDYDPRVWVERLRSLYEGAGALATAATP